MIELTDQDLIGGKQTRDVYQHPHFPDRVLKIEMRKPPGRTRWYERPPRIESSLQREFSGYADMMIRLKRHDPFIARILGLENTTRGTAVMAEHVSYGAKRTAHLGELITNPKKFDFSRSEFLEARKLYIELTDMLCEHRIYTHGLRAENLMLVDMDGSLRLRMFDFKTVVYRQLISLNYVPGASMYEQRRKISEVLARFDKGLASSFDAPPDAG